MALVNCPECGRERISDTATVCPDCGYGIKTHYDKIKQAEEDERRKIEQEREKIFKIQHIPMPRKPKFPFIKMGFTSLIFIFGFWQLSISEYVRQRSISRGDSDPHFVGKFFLVVGIGVVIYLLIRWYMDHAEYNFALSDFAAYQKKTFYKEEKAREAARKENARKRSTAIRCPNCGSISTRKLASAGRVIRSSTVGLRSGDVGKNYQCSNCRYKW